MVVSLAQLKADLGEVYSAVNDGTTAVKSILIRAQEHIKLVSGTTSGCDALIRPLTDAMVVNQVIGSIDPVNKTIGNLSVGNKDLPSMQKYFFNEARKAAILKGYSLDGLRILLEDSA